MISVKKIICGLSVAVELLFLTGCNLGPSDKTINEDADKIFELIKSEDITQLSELFSDNVKKNHNLEEELQMFFERIDGELVEYKSLDISGSSEGYDKEGNLFEKGYIGKFKKISSSIRRRI